MAKIKYTLLDKLAIAAGVFLGVTPFFLLGMWAQTFDSVQRVENNYKYGIMTAELSSSAREPFDRQVTVWGRSADPLMGGAVLFGAEFTKGVGMLLVDGKGTILHRWTMENRVYNHEVEKWWGHITPKEGFLIDDAQFLPGGDILFIQSLMDVNNFRGQRMVRMDPHDHIVWEVPGSFHHYLHVAGNPPRIYAMDSRIRNDYPGFGRPMLGAWYMEDWIEVYDLNGKKLNGWSIVDAFARSPYRNWLSGFELDLPEVQRIEMPDGRKLYDLFHMNSVQYLDAARAKALPQAQEGDLLLSMRAISAIAVFRPASGKIVWACKGPWKHQHAVQVADGKLTMFDNDGETVVTNYGNPWDAEEQPWSRVVRYTPATGVLEEIFSGSELHSVYLGNYQQLADSNWIMSAPKQGRILLTSPQQKILWQMRTVADPNIDPLPRSKEISFMHYYPAAAVKEIMAARKVTTP